MKRALILLPLFITIFQSSSVQATIMIKENNSNLSGLDLFGLEYNNRDQISALYLEDIINSISLYEIIIDRIEDPSRLLSNYDNLSKRKLALILREETDIYCYRDGNICRININVISELDKAIKLANTVIEVLESFICDKINMRLKNNLLSSESRLASAKNELKKSEEELKVFQETHQYFGSLERGGPKIAHDYRRLVSNVEKHQNLYIVILRKFEEEKNRYDYESCSISVLDAPTIIY